MIFQCVNQYEIHKYDMKTKFEYLKNYFMINCYYWHLLYWCNLIYNIPYITKHLSQKIDFITIYE